MNPRETQEQRKGSIVPGTVWARHKKTPPTGKAQNLKGMHTTLEANLEHWVLYTTWNFVADLLIKYIGQVLRWLLRNPPAPFPVVHA